MGAVVAGIGLAANIFGQKESARAQKRAYNKQAENAAKNAAAAQKQAKFDAKLHEFQAEKAIEGTKAGFAAAGVSGGSLEAVIQDSVINAEIDRMNILNGGDIRSRSFINQSVAASVAGEDIGKASTLQQLGTAFSGAASIIDKV